MPHSSNKTVNAAMDAWDRQRCGIALLEMRDQVELLTRLLKAISAEDLDDWHATCLDQGVAKIRDAVSAFINETDK